MIGYISDYDGEMLTIKVPFTDSELLQNESITQAEVKLDDGRTISAEQRKKAWAIIGDISRWSGFIPGEANEWMKYYFIMQENESYFSLSDCSVTTARKYITYLVDFCLRNAVPCRNLLLEQVEDIGEYLYSCLINRRCAVCGKPAELHHADSVGMGRNRQKIVHIGMRAYALCRKHHTEAHTLPQQEFDKRYHIYPIKINAAIADVYRLKKE